MRRFQAAGDALKGHTVIAGTLVVLASTVGTRAVAQDEAGPAAATSALKNRHGMPVFHISWPA